MNEVRLNRYCQEIEDLIDQGSLDAAVSHCQHILKVYPKHLQTYSLLGKTALEKGDLKAAADLFSRVLSIDPEDFVARVGLSIASDQDGTLEQAVWHMERAFELAPDNQAIVGELRRLYGRRDGVEPDKVDLTQGALARLHARGNLYTQAVNEFRSLLKSEPSRVDLQMALAETLWRADKRIEAAETSLAILEKLPYCLKANLILGEIWSSGGREEEGTIHLERAQKVDPENKAAQVLLGERSPLPAVEVRIGRLEYVAPPAPVEQEPDWLEAIIQEGGAPATADKAVPDWLQAVASSADVEAMPVEDVTAAEPDEVPGWLQDVAATAEVEAEDIAAAPETAASPLAEGEMPDWLAELTTEPADAVAEPLAAEEIPGWLEEAAPLDVEEPEPAFTQADLPSIEEPEAAPGEIPDWLAEMAPTEAGPPAVEGPEAEPGEIPDWLAEMAPAEAGSPTGQEPEAVPDEMPDWLTEMAPIEEEPLGLEQADLEPADIPDWLAEMAPAEAVSQEVPELDLPPAEIPDWMTETPVSEAEAATEAPAEEEAEVAAPPLVAAETPDWLAELVEAAESSLEQAPTASPAPEEAPDWLTGLQEEQAPEAAQAGEAIPGAEAESLARLEEMSPEEAFDAWETMLAENEAEEAAPPEAPEPVVAEAGEAIPETEAELMARLEEMSPEEAFAAWEAMLAESEAEEAAAPEVPEPAAAPPQEPVAAGPIVIEEPDKEALVYPKGADREVTQAEDELMARLEEMSPEEAFAAWEAMLAESEAEEAAAPEVPEPAAALPREPVAAGPIVIEEPDKEALVYPEGADREITQGEAELMARLEEMSPEEAFAAWEAMLAEDQALEAKAPAVEPVAEIDQAPVPKVPDRDKADLEPEAVAEFDDAWMALVEDEGPEAGVVEELPPAAAEPVIELDESWLPPTEGEIAAPEPPEPVEELPSFEAELAAELDQAWMALAEDVEVEELAVPEPLEEVTAAEAEPLIEEQAAPELPAWALVEAAETVLEVAPGLEDELVMGPDWVWLAEEEQAQVKIGEPEPVAPVAEALPAEPEPPTRPTWVALDEEAEIEAPAGEAPVVDERLAEARRRVAADRSDDWARLELARSLWATGQAEQARAEYERLIKSSLRDHVIFDLEQIADATPSEATMLRLLGDAYMKDNRLQEALEIYRHALASL